MSTDASWPRWLLVVRPDRHDLFSSLRQSFAGNARVEVLLDRRREERRTTETPVTTERRRRPRRRAVTAQGRAIWEDVGVRLASVAAARRRGAAGEANGDDTTGIGRSDRRPESPAPVSRGEPDDVAPGSWRLYLAKAWLEVCLDALRSERLSLCRSYLALAIWMLGDGGSKERDREVARHDEGATVWRLDSGVSGGDRREARR